MRDFDEFAQSVFNNPEFKNNALKVLDDFPTSEFENASEEDKPLVLGTYLNLVVLHESLELLRAYHNWLQAD